MNASRTYTVNDIKNMLNISRTSAYQLVNDPPFLVIKIGKNIRIPKEAFERWLNSAAS